MEEQAEKPSKETKPNREDQLSDQLVGWFKAPRVAWSELFSQVL
jgi:hypothetical protein